MIFFMKENKKHFFFQKTKKHGSYRGQGGKNEDGGDDGDG
jgi:hypothetical protein